MLWLFLLIVHISHHHAAKFSFKPSSNITNQYCLYYESILSSYCDDIDKVLTDYCGNSTILKAIDPTYDETIDIIQHSCVFYLQHSQIITKTYSISQNIIIDEITFTSINITTANIEISQSFLSISSYEGSININNIDFSSNGDKFSFIDIVSDDVELNVNINECELINMNAVNGSIVNIPNNGVINDYKSTITITFYECMIEDNMAEYGGILYIERNNVYVEFSHSDINNNSVNGDGSGGVIHWICQSKKNQNDNHLCGDLLIFDSYFDNFENNIFTIDLSMDPSQIDFNLNVYSSNFTNINGIIFNFNHNDDELAPSPHRIQEQNAFINVINSHFVNNGNKKKYIDEYVPIFEDTFNINTYAQNGTIFTMNSATVPRIVINDSYFIDNAAINGAIFNWYCSRTVNWMKDNYCGSIGLYHNVFKANKIDQDNFGDPYKLIRHGSLIYGEIAENMEFEFYIKDCNVIEHDGNSIYFIKSTAPIPDIPPFDPNGCNNNINGSFSNFSGCSNFSSPIFGNSSNFTNGSMPMIATQWIFIDESHFMHNMDIQSTNGKSLHSAIITISELDMVYTYISGSIFYDNQGVDGSAIFWADYAPIINMRDSNFTTNGAIRSGLFYIKSEESGTIEIYDTNFTDNGYYKRGYKEFGKGYAGEVSIISSGDNVNISLDIIRSRFIASNHSKYGCFDLYESDIYIDHSVFDSNRGNDAVIIMRLRKGGDLSITHSVFVGNYEDGNPFSKPASAIQGMFNINKTNIVANNVTFQQNIIQKNGIFYTDGTGSILLSDNKYIDNVLTFSAMMEAKDITVTNSTFFGNSETSLFRYDADDFAISITQCRFINNTVKDYNIDEDSERIVLVNGTIISSNSSNANIVIENSTFEQNEAMSLGGALYVADQTNLATVSVRNCIIRKNKARSGGFLFADGITINISDTDNVYQNGADGHFGGFIYFQDAKVNIKNTKLNNNYAAVAGGALCANGNNHIEMDQCDFQLNSADKGGGIFMLNSSLTCNQCNSQGNLARFGGVLFLDKGSMVEMNNTALINDTGDEYGGAVYIVNTSESTSHSHFECNGCNISYASSPNGAVLFSNDGNTVILNNNYISYSNASTSAAIYVFQTDLQITQSVFERNKADIVGGAINVARDSNVSIIECEFYENTAVNYGGSIFIGDNNKINVLNSRFEGNEAGDGGAIAVRAGFGRNIKMNIIEMDIGDTWFVDNIANESGGALYMDTQVTTLETAETYQHNISFKEGNHWEGNQAASGGAISMDFRSNTPTGIDTEVCIDELIEKNSINIAENLFVGNSVNNNGDMAFGGALHFICMDLAISKCRFDSNFASYDDGGGVGYLSNTNTFIDKSNFSSSAHSINYHGQLFYINGYDDGIAHFVIQNSIIHSFEHKSNRRMIDDDSTNSEADYSLIGIGSIASMTFDNISFTNNGVALIYDETFLCANIIFNDCQFTDNYGWTIIDMNQATMQQNEAITQFENVRFESNNIKFSLIRLLTSYTKISNSIFTENRNSAFYSTFVQVSDVEIENTKFVSNIGLYEGIVSIDKFANAIIKNSSFEDNYVDGTGGAIRSYADILTIDKCSFYNNSAYLQGGHIAQYDGELYITNSHFKYGYTKGNGGAIWRDSYTAKMEMFTKITNTTFENNYAQWHGGAILHGTTSPNKNTNFILDNVQFMQNVANHSGAAIYIKNKYNITLNINNSVDYLNNIANQIPGDITSLPNKLHASSSVSSFCPKCNVSLTIHTTDIFGLSWTPHDFHEYVLNTTHSDIQSLISIKDAAILWNYSIDITQQMQITSLGAAKLGAELDFVNQSSHFSKGNGTETFKYYPAVINDNLTLIITGISSDGTTVFDTTSVQFTVDQCEAHMGAYTRYWYDGNEAFECNPCLKGFYRFIPTYTEKCNVCELGAICYGGNEVYVANDHYPYISLSGGLHVEQCIPGSCCLESECSVWNTSNLCPANRNGSSSLCSECNEGYSVAPKTNECVECTDINFVYFLIPLFLYGGLIWWWGHKPTYDASLSFWEIYVFRILTFFYQITPSISVLIPDPSETVDHLAMIEGFFNFNFPVQKMCAFENMTNLQRQLLSLTIPIACIFWLILFSFLKKIGCCNIKNHCPKGALKTFAEFALNFYFFKALIKFFISVYAVVTRLSFQLITCRHFGHNLKMYFAADINCYEGWHILAFIGCTIACICPFGVMWRLLISRQNKERSAWWHLITLGYKRRSWWYEPYRMFCRLFIIAVAAIPIPEGYRLTLIRNLIFLYLIIHIWFLPFSKQYRHDLGFDINHLETFCMIILCLLAMLADYNRNNVLGAYSFLKWLPAVLIPCLFIWKFILHKKCKQLVPPQELMPEKTDDIFFSPHPTRSENVYQFEINSDNQLDIGNKSKRSVPIQSAWDIDDDDDDDDDAYDAERANNKLLLSPNDAYNIPRSREKASLSPTSPLAMRMPSKLLSIGHNDANQSSDYSVAVHVDDQSNIDDEKHDINKGMEMKKSVSSKIKSKREATISIGGTVYSSISQHDDELSEHDNDEDDDEDDDENGRMKSMKL